MVDTTKKRGSFYIIISITVAIIFISDLLLPLGVADGVLYILPVLFSLFLLKPRSTMVVIFVCALLIIVGFFVSPEAGIPTWIVLLNRLYSMLVIGLMSVVYYMQKKIKEDTIHEERAHIANELHDGIAQILGSITISITLIKELLSNGKKTDAIKELDKLQNISNSATIALRSSLKKLYDPSPSNQHVLNTPIEIIQRAAKDENIELTLAENNYGKFLLNPATEIELNSILKEAFRNIRKHSGVKKADVSILGNGYWLTIKVKDDGKGFEPERTVDLRNNFGLRAMKERAKTLGGDININSSPGRGTSIEIKIPIPKVIITS